MARGGARKGAGRKKRDGAEKALKPHKAETIPFGRPSLYKPQYCKALVSDMAVGYSLSAFAGLIGVSRDTINEWAKVHPDFSEAVKQGKAKRLRHWEGAAIRVAEKGGSPGTSGMVSFGLKNMSEDGEWAERSELKVGGSADGSPLRIEKIVRVIVDPNDSFANPDGAEIPTALGPEAL